MTWGVPIWFDLWLIGMAGGLGTTAFFLGLFTGDNDHKIYRFALYAGFPMVILSLLFLITDLGNPLRFWHFITQFKVTSPMSLGTWFIIAWCGLAVLLMFIWQLEKLHRRTSKINRWLVYVQTSLAFLLMAYGAVTPAVSSRALWSASFFMPPLLIFSDIAMGLAILIIIGAGGRRGNEPHKFDNGMLEPVRRILTANITQKLVGTNICVIILQVVALTAQIIAVLFSGIPGAMAQITNLYASRLAVIFWPGVIIIALGLPVTLYFLARKNDPTTRRPRMLTIIASGCIIIGGFILRQVIITAGQL